MIIFLTFTEFVTISLLFYVCFCFFGREASGILAPWTRIKPTTLASEGEVFTAGPSGKSLSLNFLFWAYTQKWNYRVIWGFYFNFKGLFIQFSTVAVPFYISTKNAEEFHFLYILTNTYLSFFAMPHGMPDVSSPTRMEPGPPVVAAWNPNHGIPNTCCFVFACLFLDSSQKYRQCKMLSYYCFDLNFPND